MDIFEAIEARHSVRRYSDRRIDERTVAALRERIDECNTRGGLNIQLVVDEPEAFGGFMARRGRFSGVANYIALIGKKSRELDERLGYYGELLVLEAQRLGLNTCWVALTYSKGKCGCVVGEGEKLACVISLGYGLTQGKAHKSRPLSEVCPTREEDMPDWFARGLRAALLAPTATNQQRFRITLTGDGTVVAEATGGFYSDMDLGIVKYHFEVGAGRENFSWS